MRRSTWLATLVLLLASVGGGTRARAESPPASARAPRDVSALLRPIRERANLPALCGAVVHGDGLVAIGVDGVRKRGAREKATTQDRWHLGSCTKAMTATLLAMLVEEKRLSWDSTPHEVFPSSAKAFDEGWKGATLERLVRHRAGAPANLDADGLWERLWNFEGSPLEARLLLVKGALARAPASVPGTAYLYSNAGYAVAGAMAERATKTEWETLIRERLFVPLGMRSAGFGAPGTRGAVDEPRGHRPGGAAVEVGPGSDNPAAIGPAGTVHASIADWGRFVSLHLRGAGRDETLLRKAAFERLHAPTPGAEPAYAAGWGVAERPWGGRVLTHSGSNTMWYCVVWMSPSKDFAVLVACNQGDAAKPCDEAAAALIGDELAARGGKPR